jgi:hypothetical protein
MNQGTSMRSRVIKIGAAVSVVLLTFYAYASLVDYRRAKEFCSQIQVGSSITEALDFAKKSEKKANLYVNEELGRIRVLFSSWHSCQCDLGIKDAKVVIVRPWCTD